MAKKKRREVKGGDRCVALELGVGMTRDEVWRAYRKACREVEEVTEEDFVTLMQPVSVLLARPYACVMNDVWEGVYHSPRLAELLRVRKGRRKGQLHYYNLLNIVEVMLGMENGLFIGGTSVSDVCHILHLGENFNHGRTSYSLEEEQERELRRIVRRLTAKQK